MKKFVIDVVEVQITIMDGSTGPIPDEAYKAAQAASNLGNWYGMMYEVKDAADGTYWATGSDVYSSVEVLRTCRYKVTEVEYDVRNDYTEYPNG